jgi:lipopolysaccharide biosynthesis glycosyltransferase
MNIVCATDNNFVQHCAATLVSILKNNNQKVTIYLLTEGLTKNNEKILNYLVQNNGGELHVILVDAETLKNCPMPQLSNLGHISIATYYRLLIPKLLPENIDKVIYFDCDIIVRQALNELWNSSISNYAIGAVYQITNRSIEDSKRLNYPVSFGYFNAGVLLINLKYWRENQISEKLFEYLILNKDSIIYHDQDALNGVLYNQCLKLPIKWNMLTIFFMKNTLTINDVHEGEIINSYSEYKKQILIDSVNPAVIHFVSKPKPWDIMCDHPYSKEYFKYLKFTPWKGFKPPKLFNIFLRNPKKAYVWVKELGKKIIQGNPYLSIKS